MYENFKITYFIYVEKKKKKRTLQKMKNELFSTTQVNPCD